MNRVSLIFLAKTFALFIYNYLNRISRGVVGIIVNTIDTCINGNVTNESAAIAYYTLFSLFPLMIFLVAISSLFLESSEAQEVILAYAEYFLPNSRELIQGNLEQLYQYRNTVGLIGTLGLLWAATSVFTILAQSINRAWHAAPQRNFLIERLIALAIVTILAFFLASTLVLTTTLTVIANLTIFPPAWNYIIVAVQNFPLTSNAVSWTILFVAFLCLYKFIPNVKVWWQDAAWGAILAATGWEIGKTLFSWYITFGLSRYQLIYGSLGTVVAFMLWVYISSLIMLVGANFSATITRYHQKSMPPPPSADTTLFSGQETAKLFLACVTVAARITEPSQDPNSFSKAIATVRDLILIPKGLKVAIDRFTQPELIETILAGAEIYQTELQQVDVNAYIEQDWQHRLAEVADILEARLTPQEATMLKQFLLDIGRHVAHQSWHHQNQATVSPDIEARLADIATILRVAPIHHDDEPS